MTVSIVLFSVSVFIVFYAMIGYPIFLIIIERILKPKELEKNHDKEPTVTYMIVAHNEEKVIRAKLENALTLDYPSEKLDILVASDNSSDSTNDIVEQFIKEHPDRRIRLYVTKEHKGKTNAQNEAQKTILSEILVMTDANAMFKKDAIRQLVSSFISEDIAYVCGKLAYCNNEDNLTSDSEATYWDIDLKMRDIESRIKTITAGNGSIYACRNNIYVDFPPIECHDSSMPQFYVRKGLKSIFNKEAIAYEKAGENDADEFKRKVRMNRDLIGAWKNAIRFLNVFKYGWFSFFYFGHRTCRHYLWMAHTIALISTICMALKGSFVGLILTILQLFSISLVAIYMKIPFKNKLLRMAGYYGMTVWAQFVAIWRSIRGLQKATWEKAESTR